MKINSYELFCVCRIRSIDTTNWAISQLLRCPVRLHDDYRHNFSIFTIIPGAVRDTSCPDLQNARLVHDWCPVHMRAILRLLWTRESYMAKVP
jgi:hypothetical protein